MTDAGFQLDGRVALITGGSKGLGKVMATALARAGADIAIASRNRESCASACDEIGAASGRKTLALECDVRDPGQVEAMIGETIERLGRIDILINNAGINIRHPAEEYSLDDWEAVIGTNLTGPFLCCKYAIPHMKERGSGRIIMLGSIMGQVALPERIAYCSTKGAIHMMTKVLALELAPHGITVNAIAPGPFMTEMNEPVKQKPEAFNYFKERIPLGRWGDPAEVGGLAVYLASDESRFMTGSILMIDGGWTAQ